MQVVFDMAPNRRADVPRTAQVFNVEFCRQIRAMEHIDAEQRHDAAAGFKRGQPARFLSISSALFVDPSFAIKGLSNFCRRSTRPRRCSACRAARSSGRSETGGQVVADDWRAFDRRGGRAGAGKSNSRYRCQSVMSARRRSSKSARLYAASAFPLTACASDLSMTSRSAWATSEAHWSNVERKP